MADFQAKENPIEAASKLEDVPALLAKLTGPEVSFRKELAEKMAELWSYGGKIGAIETM